MTHPEPFLSVYVSGDGGFSAAGHVSQAEMAEALTVMITDPETGERRFSADDESLFLFFWKAGGWNSIGQVDENGLFPWEVDDE